MSRGPTIALVGDFSPQVVAHRAIPLALERAGGSEGGEIAWTWVPTTAVCSVDRDLAGFAAVWLVPGSPYVAMEGALEAARWARETGRPFLGTCGGFQHAAIEFARHVAGIGAADHAESNPDAPELVVTPLECSLAGMTGKVRLAEGSLLHSAYGAAEVTEEYHCRYGLNPRYLDRFEPNGFRFTAWDERGEVRAAELAGHPFFVGTLFQPERAALRGETPPLVRALVRAAAGN